MASAKDGRSAFHGEAATVLARVRLRWNLSVLGSNQSLPLQPTRRCPARRPRPATRKGALSWARRGCAGVEAPRPERADSAHAQKPRCRFRGCRKARGQRRLCPRASASLPGPEPGLSGRPPSAAGWRSPRGKGADSHLGRCTLARERRSLAPLQMKASDRLPRPSRGNRIQRTWYRIYPHDFLP